MPNVCSLTKTKITKKKERKTLKEIFINYNFRFLAYSSEHATPTVVI